MRGAGGGCGWQDPAKDQDKRKGIPRFCEEPRGEEQAEIIAGKQAVCGDGVLESGIDCFRHAGGERGQFRILMRIGKRRFRIAVAEGSACVKSAPSW